MTKTVFSADDEKKHIELMSRRCFGWLLLAQILAIVPHFWDLPWWVFIISEFSLGWRKSIFYARLRWPWPWMVPALGIASVCIIGFQYRMVLTTESAVCGLVVLAQLKWLELRTDRDVRILLVLLYALLAVSLLADSGLLRTLYVLAALYVVVAAQIAQGSGLKPKQVHLIAISNVAVAIPITVILFVFFPRLAPLWGVIVQSNSGRMGMSEQMAPGNISKLTRSDQIAFQVEFNDNSILPKPSQLYWRSIVLEQFDGREWTRSPVIGENWKKNNPNPPRWVNSLEFKGPQFRYRVTVEPHGNKWMFALDTPYLNNNNLEMTPLQELRTQRKVNDKVAHEMVSYPYATVGTKDLALVNPDQYVMPANRNVKAQAFAKELFEEVGGDHNRFIDKVLSHFRTEPFYYTLEPPKLGYNAVDDFLFTSRQGFCEHYASAFSALLRTVGIPVRVVLGYQGGEWNDIGRFMTVRQYDAHAWIEVWLPQRGWTRFDPTSAVAPQRVESGLDAALNNEDRASLSFLSAARLGEQGMLNRLLNWTDSLEYRWNLWVVGYDTATQSDVLKRLLGVVNAVQVGLAMIIGSAGSLLLVALAVFWRRRPTARHPVERLFLRFCSSIREPRLQRRTEETPVAYLARLSEEVDIDVSQLQADIEDQLYNPNRVSSLRETYRLRRQLRKLRFRLAFNTPTTAS